VFPEGTVDIDWNEQGAVQITITAHRTVDTSLLLYGVERCRLKLEAGERKILDLTV